MDEYLPDLEGGQEEELHQEETDSEVLVYGIRVGLGTTQEAEGNEGRQQQDQRQHQAGVGRHVLSDGWFSQELCREEEEC